MQKTKLEAVQALQEADALEKQSREDKEAVLSFLRKELGALKPVRCHLPILITPQRVLRKQ